MRPFSYALSLVLILCSLILTGQASVGPTQMPEVRSDILTPSEGPLGLLPVTRLGGSATAIAIQGHLAYVGVGPRLLVMDISDPSAPHVLGETDAFASTLNKIVIQDPYVYAVDDQYGMDFHIFDLSDPGDLKEVGSYPVGGAWDLVIDGDFAYVGVANGTLVLNIHTPSDPFLVAQISAGAAYTGLAKTSSYLYICQGWGGVQIYDVFNPYKPLFVQSFPNVDSYASDVVVQGQYAYVAFTDGLRIFNLTAPSRPEQINHYNAYAVTDVWVYGKRAFLYLQTGKIQLLDLTDQTIPIFLGEFSIDLYAYDLTVTGGYALVADDFLRLVNLDTLDSTSVYENLSVPGPMAISGKYMYVNHAVLDLTNPANPVVAAKTNLFSMSHTQILGSTAYTSGGTLNLYDLSDPLDPQQIGVANPWTTMDLVVRENAGSKRYAYLAGNMDGLVVIDVTQPASPTKVWGNATANQAHSIATAGDTLYLGDTYGGVYIYDISDPVSPRYIDLVAGQTIDIAANSHWLVTAQTQQITVYDISSNPQKPSWYGTYTFPMSNVGGVPRIEGNTAYVLCNGIYALDLSSPEQIQAIGYFAAGPVADVTRVGEYLYLTSSSNYYPNQGITVLRSAQQSLTISGKVVDDNNQAQSGVLVSAGGLMYDISDAQGQFSISGLDAGKLTIKPYQFGSRFAPNQWVVSLTTNTTLEPFRMRPFTPQPFLDLPVSYCQDLNCGEQFAAAARGNIATQKGGRINSWFDHRIPNYETDNALITWEGRIFSGYAQTNSSECGPYLGLSCYDGHNGLDLQYMSGLPNPVLSAAKGIVVEACPPGPCTREKSYGKYVVINHQNGYATMYAHLKSIEQEIVDKFTNGATVEARTKLGVMGGTPNWDVHLHFTVFYDANGNGTFDEVYRGYTEAVDPYGWMPSSLMLSSADPWWIPGSHDHSEYLWMYPLDWEGKVDSRGVEMLSSDGTTKIQIPTGALDAPVRVHLSQSSIPASLVGSLRSLGRSSWLWVREWLDEDLPVSPATIRAEPGFAQPVNLSISFRDLSFKHLNSSQMTIRQWNQAASSWQVLPTEIDWTQQLARAQMTTSGQFDLAAPLLCPQDITEPDDLAAAGRLLLESDNPNPSASLESILDVSDDEDWFRLDVKLDKRYEVNWVSTGGQAIPHVELYAPDGETLIRASERGNLEWRADQDAVYLLRVTPAPDSSSGCGVSYRLSARQWQESFLPIITR